MSSQLPSGFAQYKAATGYSGKPDDLNNPDGEQQLTFNGCFVDVQEIYQDDKFITLIKSGSAFKHENEKRARFDDYSLVLRRITDTKGNKKPKLQLEIQSKCLRTAFAKIASNITTIALKNDPIVIPEPYQEIYYSLDKIEKALEDAKDTETKTELRLLVNFQEEFMKETIRMCKQFDRHRYIEFQWLWSIFPPGEPVIIENPSATDAPIQWCAAVKKFQLEVHDTGVAIWSITVTHSAFNGWRFGKAESYFQFPSFTGTKGITELPAYPLRFAEDRDEVLRKALERGKAYENYCLNSSKRDEKVNGTPSWHEGPMWLQRKPGELTGCRIIDLPTRTVKGRVIVDFEGFYARFPEFRHILIFDHSKEEQVEEDNGSDYYFEHRKRYALRRAMTDRSVSGLGAPDTEPSLSDEELVTFAPMVPVYSFSVRVWGLIFIDQLQTIQWDREAFGSLQVDDEIKDAIQGLIRGFSSHATEFDDFIDGKGGGLVFLLHGPPGCGKTMTAGKLAPFVPRSMLTILAAKKAFQKIHRNLSII
ncbi:hypothetical protein J7337_002094 [Fusarium musae]|uniref:DUF7025 domain-containing protein n=1 Tax=Fusarium musae TaxID=1042133 RepID=A0A9P8DNI5_9HYPO|nr:hypothetical protein J7337_002094 [Fusarium musae]KAG9505128.1 hypothetical protein J7337_002094 [Fusarium musae]